MGTDYLNLYLLHWRGSVPLEEAVEALEGLKASGEIRAWGVSNFEPADLRDLRRVPGGEGVATDQVRYHLTRRGIELALLPESQARGLTGPFRRLPGLCPWKSCQRPSASPHV